MSMQVSYMCGNTSCLCVCVSTHACMDEWGPLGSPRALLHSQLPLPTTSLTSASKPYGQCLIRQLNNTPNQLSFWAEGSHTTDVGLQETKAEREDIGR